jgi:hypothetical protein
MKESQIQKQIIDYLSINAQRYGFGFFAILNEAGIKSVMLAVLKASLPKNIIFIIINHLKKMGMVPGMPDICIIYRGQVYFIEVKTAAGKPSKRQQVIHNWLSELDVPVEVVKSVENVEKLLTEWGIMK